MASNKSFDLQEARARREAMFDLREIGRAKETPADDIERYDVVEYVRRNHMFVESARRHGDLIKLTGSNKAGQQVKCDLRRRQLVKVWRLNNNKK